MKPIPLPLRAIATLVLLCSTITRAEEPRPGWKPDQAGNYLDERQKVWFAFDGRGEGATRLTCVSCHTVLPSMLGRPALCKIAGTTAPTEAESKLLAQTRMRVENWQQLDTEAFGLFYDDSDQKKTESWGTEAVFNSLVLAFDDRYQGALFAERDDEVGVLAPLGDPGTNRRAPRAWRWLDFSEPPWGAKDSTYFGAALAAIAVGSAPGYYTPGADADTDAHVQLLRHYLRTGLDREILHNQAWALWAGAILDGLLTKDDRDMVIARLVDKQRDDGGWSLSTLGPWLRNDGTVQETASDGYATGFVLHVLQIAGVPKSNAKIARGLDWLKTNQVPTGDWRGASVVKKRDPASHVGKFMSDAATAFAVLALGH